jgi:hypothetical protein
MKILENSNEYILLNDEIYVKKEKIMMFSYNTWVDAYKEVKSTHMLVIKIIMTMENGEHYTVDKIIYEKHEYNDGNIGVLAKKELKNFIEKFNMITNPKAERVNI